MDEFRLVAASGGLGGGKIDRAALQQAMAQQPHLIASDAGTTDSGPFSLGSGRPNYPREAVKRDLALMIEAGAAAGIPIMVGSAGTAGIDAQVDWLLDIAREILVEQHLTLRTAAIYAEQEPQYLQSLLGRSRIQPLDPAPEIDAATFDRATHVVGMMGVEPLQEALGQGAQLVIAGRCSDTALYAALPTMQGFPAGLSWHVGKVVECGTLVCETAGHGVIMARIGHDHASIHPFGDGLRCTPQSVAAHSLYENADPFLHAESSGTMDFSDAVFEAIDDRSVRISGSRFHAAQAKTVKLEGAELAGYQTIIVGGIRDPFIIRELDGWLAGVRRKIEASVSDILGERAGTWHVTFHVYGRDAVMGTLEPERNSLPHEVGLVLEATAATQEIATKIAELSRQPLLHHPIAAWKGSITGFACLHNPAPIDRGPVYRFNLNHVAIPDNLQDMFRIRMLELGGAAG